LLEKKKESDPQHTWLERATQLVISGKSNNSLLLVQQEAELEKQN